MGRDSCLRRFFFCRPRESMVPQGLRRTQAPTLPRSSKMMLGKWHASNAVICVILLQSSFFRLFGLLKRLKLERALENAFRVKYARRLSIWFRELMIGRDTWRSAQVWLSSVLELPS